MKKNLEIICLILGVVLGAGFMTGKEIVIFFAIYGYRSLLILPLVCLLFFYLFKKILTTGGKVIEERMKNRVVSLLLFLLNLILACSMFSAIRVLLYGFFPSLTALICFVILICYSFLVCRGGIKKLIAANVFMLPFILLCLSTVLGVGMFMHSDTGFFFDVDVYNLPVFSVLYAMFNIAHGSVVIAKAGEGLTSRRANKLAIIAAIVLTGFIGLGIYVICGNASEILLAEMPLFLLAEKIGFFIHIPLFIAMIFASGTTLFSSLITLSGTVQMYSKRGNAFASVTVCVLTLGLSFIGFGNIIEMFYPIAGIIGTYLLLSLVFDERREKKYG